MACFSNDGLRSNFDMKISSAYSVNARFPEKNINFFIEAETPLHVWRSALSYWSYYVNILVEEWFKEGSNMEIILAYEACYLSIMKAVEKCFSEKILKLRRYERYNKQNEWWEALKNNLPRYEDKISIYTRFSVSNTMSVCYPVKEDLSFFVVKRSPREVWRDFLDTWIFNINILLDILNNIRRYQSKTILRDNRIRKIKHALQNEKCYFFCMKCVENSFDQEERSSKVTERQYFEPEGWIEIKNYLYAVSKRGYV